MEVHRAGLALAFPFDLSRNVVFTFFELEMAAWIAKLESSFFLLDFFS